MVEARAIPPASRRKQDCPLCVDRTYGSSVGDKENSRSVRLAKVGLQNTDSSNCFGTRPSAMGTIAVLSLIMGRRLSGWVNIIKQFLPAKFGPVILLFFWHPSACSRCYPHGGRQQKVRCDTSGRYKREITMLDYLHVCS